MITSAVPGGKRGVLVLAGVEVPPDPRYGRALVEAVRAVDVAALGSAAVRERRSGSLW